MNCKELSARIHEWADGELSDSEAKEIEAHIERCFPCHRQADAARNLKLLVRHRCRRATTPEALEACVRKALDDVSFDEQRSRLRTWSASPLLRAAAVILILVGGVLLTSTFLQGGRQLAHADVRDESLEKHARFLSSIDSPQWDCKSIERLAQIVQREFGDAATLPDHLGPLVPVGVSPYEYEGHRCLQVFCELGGEKISVFVLPAVPQGVPSEQKCLCFGDSSGEPFLVVCWAKGDVYFSLVAERNADNQRRFGRKKGKTSEKK